MSKVTFTKDWEGYDVLIEGHFYTAGSLHLYVDNQWYFDISPEAEPLSALHMKEILDKMEELNDQT